MAKKTLNVDIEELVDAMEQPEEFESAWYLDKQTGKLVIVSDDIMRALEDGDEDEVASDLPDWQEEEFELGKQILNDVEDRFEEVPRFEARESYALMERFVAQVADPNLREKLQIAIMGKGAFGRFKYVLAGVQSIRQQWFDLERETKREWARDWLESLDIETSWRPPKQS